MFENKTQRFDFQTIIIKKRNQKSQISKKFFKNKNGR